MRFAFEAGMKPAEFWEACFEEVVMVCQAHVTNTLNGWQQTRLMVYTIYCTVTEPDKRVDITELLHLKGDPDPEEVRQKAEQRYHELLDKQRKFTESLRAEKEM